MKIKTSGNIVELAKSLLEREETDRQKVLSGIFLVREDCVGETETKMEVELFGKSGAKYFICVEAL